MSDQPTEPGQTPPRTAGQQAGSRKGDRPRRTGRPRLLAVALAITLCVVAWGYLVWAAIDFGSTARDGDGRAWWFLALAAVGAVACLFVGLMLVARLARLLGMVPGADPDPAPRGQRSSGGKRAAR